MSIKPNIVGQGHVYKNQVGASSAPTWNITVPGASSNHSTNVVNAVPVQDFGVTHVSLLTAPNALRPFMLSLTQQFTVVKPPNGNAVLIEVSGGFTMQIPRSALLVPVLGKIASAASATMEAKTVSGGFRYIDQPSEPHVAAGSDDLVPRGIVYKQQILVQDDDPSGVYVHGFVVREEGGSTNIAVGKIYGDFAMRSLDWPRAGIAPYNPDR